MKFRPLKTPCFALAALCLLLACNAFAREDTLIMDGWRFMQGDQAGVSGQAMSPAAVNWNDASWQAISLPHCWGWQEAQQGKKNPRGPGWYRRELDVTPLHGRSYFLRFEAAGSMADVYLNGHLLGQHHGAFGAFCYEITKQLASNGTNILVVRVSNATNSDVAPLSGDFPVYGGLYRPVHLIETANENFALTDHASPGVAWLQTSVTKKQAVLDVTAQISNGTRKRQPLTFVANILDANGKRIAGGQESIILESNVTAPFSLHIVVHRPHLWNGLKDPYLYQAVVELRSDDELVDSVIQPLGLRFYRVDPDKGFFLNGEPYHLHGVDRHQDRPNKGWAISQADQDEDIALIKELGATVVRCSHYQYSDYFYSQCDRAGILAWAEIPQVDKIDASDAFAETSRNQLLDLIRQNINHPAIFCWSLFNELRPGNPDPHRELQDLNILAHGEDPTRPTIAATCTGGWPQMNKIPDLLGWNLYSGWYGEWGSLSQWTNIDKYRYTSKSGGFCVSEYGAGANVLQHEANPRQPKKSDGPWHPEEWQAIVHEEAWKEMKARPYIWGTFVWNLTDFTSYWRHEGGVNGVNDKGLVTADRKTRKDAFYFYKANWSGMPTLYIADRRFVDRTNSVTYVKVYSNAREAELFVNGASQGSVKNNGDAVFLWPKVQLAPGENKISVRAKISGKNVSDGCVWNLHQPAS
jgi:beta-galactosidase